MSANIYEDELKNGQIAFSSTFFDDITNSTLISLTAIKERKFLSRAISAEEVATLNNSSEWFFFWIENPNEKARIKSRTNRRKNNSVW